MSTERTVNVTIRVSPAERDAIASEAKERGQSIQQLLAVQLGATLLGWTRRHAKKKHAGKK